jgi:hypothetical protein
LADIAAEVRGCLVHLTQVFQQVEGLPLYCYQLRLRARGRWTFSGSMTA